MGFDLERAQGVTPGAHGLLNQRGFGMTGCEEEIATLKIHSAGAAKRIEDGGRVTEACPTQPARNPEPLTLKNTGQANTRTGNAGLRTAGLRQPLPTHNSTASFTSLKAPPTLRLRPEGLRSAR